MNPNYRRDYVEPKSTSDKMKDAWDKTKEVGHDITDKTVEALTGQTPVERHERNIQKEEDKLADKTIKHYDDPKKIDKEFDKRGNRIKKEEDKLMKDVNPEFKKY